MNRFRPSLTAFEERLNLSPLAPVESFAAAAPSPEPIVTFEYLLLGAVPAAPKSDPLPVLLVIANRDYYHDDVVVDGRIITGEVDSNPASNDRILHGTQVDPAGVYNPPRGAFFLKNTN